MKPLLVLLSGALFMTSSFASNMQNQELNLLEKMAQESYANLKNSDKDDEAELSMRQVNKLIKTKGTYENTIINEIIDSCYTGNQNCGQDLTSAMKNMYASKSKKLLDVTSFTCGEIHLDSTAYHLLVYGRNKPCGITTIGPGLNASMMTIHGMICTHSKKGINVGAYAEVNAIAGMGFGVTVGRSGLCTVFNMNFGAIGAFAGSVIINTKKFN